MVAQPPVSIKLLRMVVMLLQRDCLYPWLCFMPVAQRWGAVMGLGERGTPSINQQPWQWEVVISLALHSPLLTLALRTCVADESVIMMVLALSADTLGGNSVSVSTHWRSESK